MRLLWLMTVLVALLVPASGNHSSEEGTTEGIHTNGTSSAATPSAEGGKREAARVGSSENKTDAKFLLPLVYSSTLVVYNIQSVTSTIPFTCFNSLTGTATPCTGRRRRRRRSGRLSRPRALEAPALTSAADPDLLGSLSEDRVDPAVAQNSRLVLTSWVTQMSSVTIVTTVTKYDTTVSLGMLCTIGGTDFFKTCP